MKYIVPIIFLSLASYCVTGLYDSVMSHKDNLAIHEINAAILSETPDDLKIITAYNRIENPGIFRARLTGWVKLCSSSCKCSGFLNYISFREKQTALAYLDTLPVYSAIEGLCSISYIQNLIYNGYYVNPGNKKNLKDFSPYIEAKYPLDFAADKPQMNALLKRNGAVSGFDVKNYFNQPGIHYSSAPQDLNQSISPLNSPAGIATAANSGNIANPQQTNIASDACDKATKAYNICKWGSFFGGFVGAPVSCNTVLRAKNLACAADTISKIVSPQ